MNVIQQLQSVHSSCESQLMPQFLLYGGCGVCTELLIIIHNDIT